MRTLLASVRGRATVLALSTVLALVSCGGGGSDSASPEAPAAVTYHPAGTQIPVSGPNVPGVAPLDQGVTDFMRQWNIPGVAVAIAKDGRLILARGYGYADFEAKQPVQPDSMFRVASISKISTMLAIMRLRDQGQLNLEQTFLSILTEYQVAPGGDPRLRDITLRNLLQHSGGWNRDAAGVGDIPFQGDAISKALGVPQPVTSADIIRYLMTQPLQFAPGTGYAYSNAGFIILGRVIEKVSGQSYERYVREQVLAPLGINAMSIAFAHLSQRGQFEVKYYGNPIEPVLSEFPGEGRVPRAYAFQLSSRDAASAWVASPIDLTRLIAALDPALRPGFISQDSLTQILAPPPYSGGSTSWYGLGLEVGPTNQAYGHGGVLPGTNATVVHSAAGYSIAAIINTRYPDVPLQVSIGALIRQAIGTDFAGSATDLYSQYPSPSLPASGP